MSQEKYFVTGAAGAVGQVVVRDLLDRGHAVRALLRDPNSRNVLPDDVEIFTGDLSNEEVLKRAVDSVDVVFHLAAKLHIENPDESLRDEYQLVNVKGTQTLVDIAAAVPRFVYFSTIAVYGGDRSQPELITESDEAFPDTLYAQTKREAELAVLDKNNGVVLRLAAVYGMGMKGNYPRLINALKKRRFLYIGSGTNRRTLVHVSDVSRAAVLAAANPVAVGNIYNVTDGAVHSTREIIETICSTLQISGPLFHLPERPVRMLAAAIEDIFAVAGKRAPIGRVTIDKFLEDVAVSGEKIEAELGFRPQYDLESGWREALAQR